MLQGKRIDIADASHLLDSLKSVILSKGNNKDGIYINCHRIILETANKLVINENKAFTAIFLKNHESVSSESVFDCFLKVATILLLDHLLTRLNVRFDRAFVMKYNFYCIMNILIRCKHLSPLQSFIAVTFPAT